MLDMSFVTDNSWSESQNANKDLVIYKDGSFGIIKGDITAQQLVDNGAMQVLSFRPALIENGQSGRRQLWRSWESREQPAYVRYVDDTYVFVVSNGQCTSESLIVETISWWKNWTSLPPIT